MQFFSIVTDCHFNMPLIKTFSVLALTEKRTRLRDGGLKKRVGWNGCLTSAKWMLPFIGIKSNFPDIIKKNFRYISNRPFCAPLLGKVDYKKSAS
jgi:hypothetical protein